MSLTQPAEPRSEPRWHRAIYPVVTVLITVLVGAARLLQTRAFGFGHLRSPQHLQFISTQILLLASPVRFSQPCA